MLNSHKNDRGDNCCRDDAACTVIKGTPNTGDGSVANVNEADIGHIRLIKDTRASLVHTQVKKLSRGDHDRISDSSQTLSI